ncbi:MAG TPA: SPOR domain-containing protein [Steroidobacteraceae bacterium]|nr:SPOR domain-containing protein [Steroidobacteraceae bacterium]
MALEVPDAPELEGFAVFRSRRVEDGRDRYRLHLGYFESREDAQRVLPIVRARYPASWIALAPPDSMGSLDDTNVAQFKFIRQNPAKAAPRAVSGPTPIRPTVKATLVAPRSSPASSAPVPPASTRTVNRVPMTPAQVLQLLESAPRARTPVAPPKPPNEPAAGSFAQGQKFAVQLVWSTTPVQTGNVPQLAIFEAYTLYSVQVERAGRRWYGMRLGFFKDPLSARQVALYARSDFSAAAVVPVSDRECEKATAVAAAAHAAPSMTMASARRSVQPTDEIVLTPDHAATPERPKPAATPARAAAGLGSVQSMAKRPTGKRRTDKTAEELLEELGADELTIANSTPNDELSESGVRHLSVSVVNRRSPLARLFDRVARKRAHH